MADQTVHQIHEVFLGRAQGVGHLMRDRVWRMVGFASNEPLRVELLAGVKPTLRFRRVSDGDALIEIGEITPIGLTDLVWGEEQTLHSREIGSTEEIVDNRNGVSSIDLKFSDVFSETHSSSESEKMGENISLTIKSSQKIEGVASFDESMTVAANHEISNTHGKSVTRGGSGEERTTIPVGKRVRITEIRTQSDVVIPVTAKGKFTHTFGIGKHSSGNWKGDNSKGHGWWPSWEDFVLCVLGNAPDNWDFATSLREHPPWRADLWALNEIQVNMAYTVKFTGRVQRRYTVEKF